MQGTGCKQFHNCKLMPVICIRHNIDNLLFVLLNFHFNKLLIKSIYRSNKIANLYNLNIWRKCLLLVELKWKLIHAQRVLDLLSSYSEKRTACDIL